MYYSGRVFGGGGGNLWGVLAFMFVSFFESFIRFFKSTQFIDIFKTKLRPLGVLMLLAFLISFNTTANATLPAAPVQIVNELQTRIVGTVKINEDAGWVAGGFRYMVTKATTSSEIYRTQLNVSEKGFATKSDCDRWIAEQNNLIVPVLEVGKVTTQKVVAGCSDTKITSP